MYTKGAAVAQRVKCALAPLVCHEPWGCVPEFEVLYFGLLCLWYFEFILSGLLSFSSGFLFCKFAAPALMVSPEVHADQGRGAMVLPAGI